MKSALDYRHFYIVKRINKPVFLSYTTRPVTLQIEAQRFRLANA
jgi:hypothetical protein